MPDFSMEIINRNGAEPPINEHVDDASVLSDHARNGVVSSSRSSKNTPSSNIDTSGLDNIDPSSFLGLNLLESLAVGNALELSKIKVLDEIRKSLYSVNNSLSAFARSVISKPGDNKGGKGTISSGGSGVNLDGVVGSLKGINESLVKSLELQTKRTEIETERHEYEKTPIKIVDLDGENAVRMSPRELEAVNNASQARVATDTNNFELSASDLDDLFGDLPDISGLFDVPFSSSVDSEYVVK